MKSLLFLLTIYAASTNVFATAQEERPIREEGREMNKEFDIQRSEEEWKEILTPEQYFILREKGTEYARTGIYDKFYEKGVYYSAATGQALFSSEAKFDSGSGWPSFWEPIDEKAVEEFTDGSLGMVRTEVMDSLSGSHLGHVFNDGPGPTGMRYCINSAALIFVPDGQPMPETLVKLRELSGLSADKD